MIELAIREIAEAVSARYFPQNLAQDTLVAGVSSTDSRNIKPGGIFFAKPGEHSDGHLYLPQAEAAGAVLAIVERPDASLSIPQLVVDNVIQALSDLAALVLSRVRAAGTLEVIAVTGSNGKTSTKNMLRAILSEVAETVAPHNSFNNEVGAPLTLLRLTHSTRYLIMELGAAGRGSIAKLARLVEPDIGIELKVGMAHAGAFGGPAVTAEIKAEMMPFIKRAAILNYDDPAVVAMSIEGLKQFGFGFDSSADYRLERVELSLAGTRVNLRYPDGEKGSLVLQILGEHQAMNAAAALAAADQLGVDRKLAAAALEKMPMAERWRMQLIKRDDGVIVINDAYNASPDSMRAALQTLATLGRQGHRTIAVLGEMAELGEFAREEHDALGRLVVRYNIDQLFVIGERAKLIHLGAMMEGSWDGESEFFATMNQAFESIREKLLPGDVVLVKSSNAAELRFLGDQLAEALQ